MRKPSLSELAAIHAERRLTKKDRNAALRGHGYDPDGDDGRLYRKAFATARQSREMGRWAASQAEGAEAVYLWDLQAADWADAVAAGLTEMPLAAYRERLAIVEQELLAAGRQVVRVPATVADMLATLAERDWPNDTQHRAAALRFIHEAHQ